MMYRDNNVQSDGAWGEEVITWPSQHGTGRHSGSGPPKWWWKDGVHDPVESTSYESLHSSMLVTKKGGVPCHLHVLLLCVAVWPWSRDV